MESLWTPDSDCIRLGGDMCSANALVRSAVLCTRQTPDVSCMTQNGLQSLIS